MYFLRHQLGQELGIPKPPSGYWSHKDQMNHWWERQKWVLNHGPRRARAFLAPISGGAVDFATGNLRWTSRVTDEPYTVGAWARPDTLPSASDPRFLYLGSASSTSDFLGRFTMLRTGSGSNFRWEGSGFFGDTGNAFSANVWHSVIGSSPASNSHIGVLAGDWANRVNNTSTASTPTNTDRFSIGSLDDSRGPGFLPWPGAMAEAFCLDIGWSAEADFAAYDKGLNIFQISPNAVTNYGAAFSSPWNDVLHDEAASASNASKFTHPPVMQRPRRRPIAFEVAAPPAGANPKGPLGMPFHGPFGGPV